jgi:transcription initiation factor TFIIE subunit beta
MAAAAPASGKASEKVNGNVKPNANGQVNGKSVAPMGGISLATSVPLTLVPEQSLEKKRKMMGVPAVEGRTTSHTGQKFAQSDLKSKQRPLEEQKPKQNPLEEKPKQKPIQEQKLKQDPEVQAPRQEQTTKPEPVEQHKIKQEPLEHPMPKLAEAAKRTNFVRSLAVSSVAAQAEMDRPRIAGTSLITNLRYAEDYLKDKRRPVAFKEIASYLSLHHAPPEVQAGFRARLRAGPKVNYDPAKGLFSYRPTLPFADAEGMRAYLRVQPFAGGVRIDDVKDGWPACMDEIERMTRDHEVLLLRDRRGLAKAAHADGPALWPPPPPAEDDYFDLDFDDDTTEATSTANGAPGTPMPVQTIAWKEVKLPRTPEDLRVKLKYAGLRTTTAAKEKNKLAAKKLAKKKTHKRGGRTTNIHIQHLLKDYSNRRA